MALITKRTIPAYATLLVMSCLLTHRLRYPSDLESEPKKMTTETKPQIAVEFSAHPSSPVRVANQLSDKGRRTPGFFGRSWRITQNYLKTET